ncbi:hypothetical protein [Amaricoccus solimangrovi]|uniref:Uncharacterized protein n=1 Tax=Amaricoccus solimangrovi TaxID=2589815 RepID=A0A501WLC3_9RHOB|nr:hypothetical protein [Amaricoccus solimangrovi]TPE50158.1 hypothetical protein FJM51_12275 [Amaricoccus solimangrovi]
MAIAIEALRVLAWPTAAYLIARIYRSEIKALFPRVRRIGPSSIELDIDTKQASISDKSSEDIIESARSPLTLAHPAIIEMEEFIKERLEQIDQGERSDFLIRAAAVERAEKHCAFVYINIFGSQIEALQLANQRGGPVSWAEAEEAFSKLKLENPAFLEWNLHKYLRFLFVNNLIIQEGDMIFITNMGKYFLLFLAHYGLEEKRPL